ncbi:alpha/beta hydrolase, partial [Stenotrophomonas maltophilia]|nr:alpha/beta hydrolase [Stenotrophomonas maltophilia]
MATPNTGVPPMIRTTLLAAALALAGVATP